MRKAETVARKNTVKVAVTVPLSVFMLFTVTAPVNAAVSQTPKSATAFSQQIALTSEESFRLTKNKKYVKSEGNGTYVYRYKMKNSNRKTKIVDLDAGSVRKVKNPAKWNTVAVKRKGQKRVLARFKKGVSKPNPQNPNTNQPPVVLTPDEKFDMWMNTLPDVATDPFPLSVVDFGLWNAQLSEKIMTDEGYEQWWNTPEAAQSVSDFTSHLAVARQQCGLPPLVVMKDWQYAYAWASSIDWSKIVGPSEYGYDEYIMQAALTRQGIPNAQPEGITAKGDVFDDAMLDYYKSDVCHANITHIGFTAFHRYNESGLLLANETWGTLLHN